MRTECKQARFEFHGLFQRKVKARFDGGKITSDAGVLLLREVERGTGLIAGLAECFRDHRDHPLHKPIASRICCAIPFSNPEVLENTSVARWLRNRSFVQYSPLMEV